MKENLTVNEPQMVPPNASNSRGRWLVIGIAISLVAIPLLWAELPSEIARWHCAAAAEAELDGELARALEIAGRAIQWNPTNSDLLAYRASLQLALNNLDAAEADASQAIALAPDGSMYAYYQRVLASQRRGDHEQAFQDVDKILSLAADRTPPRLLPTGQLFGLNYDHALNLRAYSRALAETNIEGGLKDIAEAFDRVGNEDIAAYLDTRGYLFYLAGEFDSAEADIEKAVQMVEATRVAFEQQVPVGDRRTWNRQASQLKEEFAVILQHRGRVREALGRSDEAEEDFRLAKEYGYDPEKGVW